MSSSARRPTPTPSDDGYIEVYDAALDRYELIDPSEQAGTDAHLIDPTAAHAASAVAFTPTGTVAATDVQAAVAEVASEATAGLAAHIADGDDAHDASAVSVLDAGAIYTATNVETALAEVPTLISTHSADALAHPALKMWTPAAAPLQYPVASAESPTVGAIATVTAISTPKILRAAPVNTLTYSPTQQVLASPFTDRGVSTWIKVGVTNPDYYFVQGRSSTDPVGGGFQGGLAVEFETDALELEFLVKGIASSYCWVWVDDKPIGGIAPTWSLTGSAALTFLPLTFATRAHRRIRFESSTLHFGGIYHDAIATVQATTSHRPRCVVLGDSFTEGGTATVPRLSAFARTLGHLLGWDVHTSGVGGTGYLAPGSGGRVKFRDRVVVDVIDHAPDIVVVAGGFNDIGNFTAAQIGAEATLLYAQLRAALPSARLVVVGPWSQGGVEKVGTGAPAQLDAKDALEAAAVAVGAVWVDVLEIPLRTGTAAVGTLTTSPSAAATSFGSSIDIPLGVTVEIGTGAARERRVVTASSGGAAPPHTLTVAALSFAHTTGDAISVVGPSMWTGVGRVGATTGAGNSDLLVSSDATHPTQSGHEAIAWAVASQICAGW